MKVGSFGKIIFEVSDRKILTPQTLTRSGGAVWADHPMLYKKQRREFMHSEPRSVEVELKLRSSLGVSPADTIKLMYKYMENGKRYHLIIGDTKMSNYRMAIMTISDTWDTVIKNGKLVAATVTVTFEEVPI